MALKITDACIACDACVNECPTDAIIESDPIYIIDSKLCVECVEFYEEPQCALVCSVDCIVLDQKKVNKNGKDNGNN